MKRSITIVVALLLALAASLLMAQPSSTAAKAPAAHMTPAPASQVAMSPADLKWGDAPPFLSPGAKLAVLQGDPTKAGNYVIRLKLPDGYLVSPHWHPTGENVTVLSGTANFGMGDTVDKTKTVAYGAGSFAAIGPQMHHYVWFSGESEIQIHGVGPFMITYLHAADDPRHSTTK